MKNEKVKTEAVKMKNNQELGDYLTRKEEERQLRVAKRQEKKEHLLAEKNRDKQIREQYKEINLKNNAQFKEAKEKIRRKHHLFRLTNFFTKWFYVGLGLILLSVILALVSDIFVQDYNMKSLIIILEILSGMLSTIGIALLVGCVFDFSKNSEAFLTFVSKILKDIIVSKTFLSSLTSNDKREALKLILQPSFKQIEQYSNINEYFKKKIDDSMKMFDTNFKTNLILNIEARKNNEGLVYCESVLTYVVYKLGDKFEPIKVSYEKDGSRTKEVKLIHDGKEYPIKLENILTSKESQNGITQEIGTFDIPEKLTHNDKLTLKRKVYEPGHDHWINYVWKSLTPYEGISCHLKCFDGLTVKDFQIYDNKSYYQVERSEDKTTIDIISSRWLEPDTGFFITISDAEIETKNITKD